MNPSYSKRTELYLRLTEYPDEELIMLAEEILAVLNARKMLK